MSSRFTTHLVHDIAYGRCSSLSALEFGTSFGNVTYKGIAFSFCDSTSKDLKKSLLFVD
jgi:hypothetical protein